MGNLLTSQNKSKKKTESNEKLKNFLEILKFYKPYLLPFIIVGLLVLIDVGYNIGIVWIQQTFINTINEKNLNKLILLIKISSIVTISAFVLLLVQNLIRNIYQAYILRDISVKVFDKTNTIPLEEVQQWHSGDLVSRIVDDSSKVSTIVGGTSYDLISYILLCSASFIYLTKINLFLALLAAATGPLIIMFYRVFEKKISSTSLNLQNKTGEVRGLVQEYIQGIPIVKSFNMGEEVLAKFQGEKKLQNNLQKRQTMLGISVFVCFTAGSTGILLFSTYIISLAVIKGQIGPGTIMAFIYLMFKLQGPFLSITTALTNILQGLAVSERVFSILNIESERNTIKKDLEVNGEDKTAYAINFKDVDFSFKKDQDAEHVNSFLSNVNLTIKKGEIVAIVGPSGSGKSTIARLCCGLMVPTSGEIEIFGVSTKSDLNFIRQQISYVPQSAYLFTGTINENISLGVEKVTQEEIYRAAKEANAHEFIEELPNKYETILGEKGVALSGGQRQRIGIARAFLRRNPLMILDEATSALDNKSEILIQNSISRLVEGKTALIIAHRLSTIKIATRILVVENGQIVEDGTHDELINLGGLYSRLYKIQFNA